MVFEAEQFVFKPPSQVGRARRVLIKPCATHPLPYPFTTSREILETIISGIRQAGDADILILEASPSQEPMRSLYRDLGYDFPRVLALDAKDCVLVEVENPLPKPFALPTFWLPNVLLSCDYLIGVTPFKTQGNQGCFTISNLLSLLPVSKYGGEAKHGWEALHSFGLPRVIADLYFTLPFDMGIIEANKKFLNFHDPNHWKVEECGKVFVGEPYEVDCETSQAAGLETEYLRLIELGKTQLQSFSYLMTYR